MWTRVALVLCTLMAVGCKTPSPSPTQAPKPAPPTAPTQQKPAPAPAGVEHIEPSPPQPPPPPPPATQAEKRQAQEHALRAADMLDLGREAQAKEELAQGQLLDPDNALVKTLKQSIESDPLAELGRGSWNYMVKSGDTLSKLAGQYMKDEYKFYLLARYNSIAVPKSLTAGRQIKIPGVKPPEVVRKPVTPAAPPLGTRGQPADPRCEEGWQLASGGDRDKAYDILSTCPDARSRTEAERLRPELVQLHERKAKEAYRRQELDTAIREWDRVLKIDPGYDIAKMGRERAVDLKRHLEGVR